MNTSMDYHSNAEVDSLLLFISSLKVKYSFQANPKETTESSKLSSYINLTKLGYSVNSNGRVDKDRKLQKEEIDKFFSDLDANTLNHYNYNQSRDSFSLSGKAPLSTSIHQFVEENPYYLKLLFEHGVGISVSRLASNFEILSFDSSILPFHLLETFKEEYEKNRAYYVDSLYNISFVNQKNYDEFSAMFIALMTAIDILGDSLIDYNNIEILNQYHITNLLYSYGITFLDDMPLFYKKRLLKNINFLIRNKGSNLIFTSILSIFGFNNVNVFKYYLSKETKKDSNGNFLFGQKELVFYKVPFERKSLNEAIQKRDFSKLTYEQVVTNDKYWKVSTQELLKKDFEQNLTKYYDIVSVIDMQKVSMGLSFFYHTLNEVEADPVYRNSIKINSRFSKNEGISLFSLMVAMNVITFRLAGWEPLILKNANHLHAIDNMVFSQQRTTGYSFKETFEKASFSPFLRSLIDVELLHPLKDIRQAGSINNIVDMIDSNLDLKKKIEKLVIETQDIDEYESLLKDLSYAFSSQMNLRAFEDFTSYIDFLKVKSPLLAGEIEEIFSRENPLLYAEDLIIEIVSIIELVIESENVNFFGFSSKLVIDYIKRLIEYFKSFTVQLKNLSILYRFDDYNQVLRLFDKAKIESENSVSDESYLKEKIDTWSTIKLFSALPTYQEFEIK